jgi:hypothetical protein
MPRGPQIDQPIGQWQTFFVGHIYFFQTRETLRHLPGAGFADDPVSYNRKMMQVMLNGLLPAKE